MNIRQLKCELAKAGFTRLKGRGKGSHTVWKHPDNNTIVVYSGRARSHPRQTLSAQSSQAICFLT
jgi:predicted RNA binding protein YcfA (HicA-like mRNA interferase family)